MGIRAQQKEKTRRSLIDAAFGQLSADRGFSNLSLREVLERLGSHRLLFIAILRIWMSLVW